MGAGLPIRIALRIDLWGMAMLSNDRDTLRRVYVEAWRKHRAQLPLEGVEPVLVEVVLEHPEYHDLLADEAAALGADFRPEAGQTNPFLHMGMHIAIREQLATDRPTGFRAAYRDLVARLSDPHTAEHHVMECLGQALWEAQRAGRPPDEAAYLDCVTGLGRR
jgi:hypothetical protein